MANDPTEFAQLLMNHAKGRAHDKASAKLNEAVEAVKRTGKGGEVSVKFSIHPVKNNDQVVRIESHVGSKVPEEAVTSIWYADDGGTLHRNDPNQDELPYTTTASDAKTAAAGPDK